MNKLHKKFLIGLTVLGLGTAALTAHAEKDECPHMGGALSMDGHRAEGDGKFEGGMKVRMEKHHVQLHDKLKLSAAQETAWKTFTAAMMPADHVKHDDKQAMMENLSAPERMEKMMVRMKEGEERMSARLLALKTFYATLSAEQKKTFDENFMPGPHHGQHEHAKK